MISWAKIVWLISAGLKDYLQVLHSVPSKCSYIHFSNLFCLQPITYTNSSEQESCSSIQVQHTTFPPKPLTAPSRTRMDRRVHWL